MNKKPDKVEKQFRWKCQKFIIETQVQWQYGYQYNNFINSFNN